jgi:hypothetical protein
MILTGKNEEIGEKLLSVPLLSTTNHTWTDLGTNLGLHGERIVITNY